MTKLEAFLEAGVHFGHQVGRWNSKMAPYIHETKNGVHKPYREPCREPYRWMNSQIQIQAPPNAPKDEILPRGNPRC